MVKIEIESVRDPRWSSEDGSTIDCLVKTNTLIHEAQFTASIHDPEPHGREIYKRCVAGEFGEVAPMKARETVTSNRVVEVPPELLRLNRFLLEANRENSQKSYRSVVIVWASFLDNVLDEMIENDAVRTAGSGQKFGKPPRTFDKRIDYALNRDLIDQIDAEKCHHIRRVRNQAAHQWELSLGSKDVLPSLRALYEVDHSNLLVFHEELEFLIQQVYSGSCAMLIIKFLGR